MKGWNIFWCFLGVRKKAFAWAKERYMRRFWLFLDGWRDREEILIVIIIKELIVGYKSLWWWEHWGYIRLIVFFLLVDINKRWLNFSLLRICCIEVQAASILAAEDAVLSNWFLK